MDWALHYYRNALYIQTQLNKGQMAIGETAFDFRSNNS